MVSSEQSPTASKPSALPGWAPDCSVPPVGSEVIEFFRLLLLQELHQRQVSS